MKVKKKILKYTWKKLVLRLGSLRPLRAIGAMGSLRPLSRFGQSMTGLPLFPQYALEISHTLFVTGISRLSLICLIKNVVFPNWTQPHLVCTEHWYQRTCALPFWTVVWC